MDRVKEGARRLELPELLGREFPVEYRITEEGCFEVISHRPMKAGYICISLKGEKVYVHRLVWEHHHGPIPKGLNVCHKCDNPPCVNEEHFFLGTQPENVKDMMDKDRNGYVIFCGEAHTQAKLSDEKVIEIVKARGVIRQVDLARTHGVSQALISAIQRKKTWRHITDENANRQYFKYAV